jgi:hypothetical protein
MINQKKALNSNEGIERHGTGVNGNGPWSPFLKKFARILQASQFVMGTKSSPGNQICWSNKKKAGTNQLEGQWTSQWAVYPV